MAIQKLQARETVRVLADRTTLTSQQDPSPPTPQNKQPLLFSNTQSHGHMAPSFRRKNLVCFYCNKKSDIKYDGLISRWDCTQCESTNFLDEVLPSTRPSQRPFWLILSIEWRDYRSSSCDRVCSPRPSQIHNLTAQLTSISRSWQRALLPDMCKESTSLYSIACSIPCRD
jgi:hypothetical protein